MCVGVVHFLLWVLSVCVMGRRGLICVGGGISVLLTFLEARLDLNTNQKPKYVLLKRLTFVYLKLGVFLLRCICFEKFGPKKCSQPKKCFIDISCVSCWNKNQVSRNVSVGSSSVGDRVSELLCGHWTWL